jgi:hypothetical protein
VFAVQDQRCSTELSTIGSSGCGKVLERVALVFVEVRILSADAKHVFGYFVVIVRAIAHRLAPHFAQSDCPEYEKE